MVVKILKKEDYKKYETFLLDINESLFYYSTKYKDFLESLLNIKSHYLLAIDDNKEIQAVLPLMKKEGKYGTIINSLPYYGSNAGVLFKSKEAQIILLEYYREFVSTVSGATYITNPLCPDEEIIKSDVTDTRIGHWTSIDYSGDIENNIMLSYHSKTRNLVRKAMKLNIKIEIDNSQKEFLYHTHVSNMSDIGGKSKNKYFFDFLDRFFEQGKDYNIYVAKLDGIIISAVLLFYYNNIVEYFTPVVLKKYRSYQPISLIIYKAMIDAAGNGNKWWNWGGTWLSQDGVYHFKKRFGAITKEYKYFIKINNNAIYNATREELLNEYDGFYVIPFNKLKDNKNG